MTIWCTRIACWIIKAADTDSEYVIFIPFPLQQWLLERASLLRYTHSTSSVLFPNGRKFSNPADIVLWMHVTHRMQCAGVIKTNCNVWFGLFYLEETKEASETLLTYLLTYSMVQSPSWAANWFAVSQGIPRISRNPKVIYGTHKRTPTASLLGQPNPIHIPPPGDPS